MVSSLGKNMVSSLGIYSGCMTAKLLNMTSVTVVFDTYDMAEL